MIRTLIAAFVISAAFAPLAPATASERGYSSRDARAEPIRVVQSQPSRHNVVNQRDARRHAAPAPRHAPPRHVAPRHAPRPQTRYVAPRYVAPRYAPPRGYQARHWQRGHYLPASYRAAPYVIDYRAYRLAPPPRGYHYVRVDDRAVLVAITSGLIAEVLSDLFYR